MSLLQRLINSIDHLMRSGALFYETVAGIVRTLYWQRMTYSKPVLGFYMQVRRRFCKIKQRAFTEHNLRLSQAENAWPDSVHTMARWRKQEELQ